MSGLTTKQSVLHQKTDEKSSISKAEVFIQSLKIKILAIGHKRIS